MTSAPQPYCIQSAIPTLAGALTGLEAGTLSAREILEDCLARIAARDDVLHAFAHLDAAAARQVAQAPRRGPLGGIPWAVKDNFDVAGLPATANSRLRAGRIATQDAALVTALRNTGAVVLGKLAIWEFGTGTGAEHFDLPNPPARNPWDPRRFTGGSSTGAGVAVAAGMELFAIGSDTTGSVRIPAAATGCCGLVMTPGRLHRGDAKALDGARRAAGPRLAAPAAAAGRGTGLQRLHQRNDADAREPRWTARAGAVQRLLARGPAAALACKGAAGWGGGVAAPRHGLRGGHALAQAAAGVTPPRFEARAAELAAAMLQAGARLPRDWPKELRPANPAAEDDDKTGERKNG